MRRVYTDYSQLPLFLTSREIQVVLGISRQFAERLFRSGTLPATKVGSQWRVAKADLIKYFEKGGD